ncbi:Epidermal growth factor-like protein [Formica fusca]
MKFLYVIFILTILQNRLITEVLSLLKAYEGYLSDYPDIEIIEGEGKCSGTVSVRVTKQVPYLETYKEKTWGIFYKTRTRWNYRLEYYTSWRKRYTCCDGYELKMNMPSLMDIKYYCEPICQPKCGNGNCIKPNICKCFYGYEEKHTFFDPVCVPTCNHSCVHGKCTAPDVCTCNDGYSLSMDGYTCKPVCTLSCHTGSYCSEPNHCACLNGYTNIIYNGLRILNKCKPVCENSCVNGECTAPDTCTCNNGYELDSDNIFVCKPKCEHDCLYGTCTAPNVCTCDKGYSLKTPSTCEPICSEACVMGTCVAPESCSCFEGYGLLENSKHICEPVCEKACLNGRCTAPSVCTCNEGFQLSGDESTKHVCEPYCEISCEPFGVCTAPNVCTCIEGYRLVDKTQTKKTSISYFADNSVCEPICDTECINGFCSAPDTCSCNTGYQPSGGNFTNICEPICSRNCVNSICSAPEICTCNKGYRPSKNNSSNICEPFCEADCINGYCSAPNECTCNFGYQPTENNRTSLCEPICNPSCKNGICVQPNICNCKPGYRQSTHSMNVCDPICHPACKTNGICNAPDLCICEDNYRMVYYDEKDVPFRCEPICTVDCGNGTCTAPDLCTCFDGYRNTETGRCEPFCSTCNNGTCVAPEVCECDDGFVLEDSGIGPEVKESRLISEDRLENASRCVPHCESCDNGDCVAPDECQCHVGFVKIKGICVHACQDGCGAHGECIDERRICECNYGWTGPHCDQPTLCISILNDEDNRTESLNVIEEQNNTIEHVLINNPACPQCINKINNETLCFKMYINDTQNKTQIGCLINKVFAIECLELSRQYRNNKEIIKLSGIACGFGILLLIGAVTTYIVLRKRRNRQIGLGDEQVICRHNTLTQGLLEQSNINS